MRRSTLPLPELRDTCRHHDPGLPCGIDGKPCIGHKEEVRAARKRVTVAKYRHREMVKDAEGNDVEGPWIHCPKLRRDGDEPPVSDM